MQMSSRECIKTPGDWSSGTRPTPLTNSTHGDVAPRSVLNFELWHFLKATWLKRLTDWRCDVTVAASCRVCRFAPHRTAPAVETPGLHRMGECLANDGCCENEPL